MRLGRLLSLDYSKNIATIQDFNTSTVYQILIEYLQPVSQAGLLQGMPVLYDLYGSAIAEA